MKILNAKLIQLLAVVLLALITYTAGGQAGAPNQAGLYRKKGSVISTNGN